MRKILPILFLISSVSLHIRPQGYEKHCYYGITFEVSKNPNWGFGELVITNVEPNSPAEKTGIKAGDIIMEINGKATYLRNNQIIADWLFSNMYTPEVLFTIRNMNTYFKEYTLNRKCIAVNSASEKELSQIFSFYSLENTNQQRFTLPLSVELRKETDYTDYHSYDFYKPGEDVPAIDKEITALVEKELEAKGLVRDTSDPDIVVQIYYDYKPNPHFTGLNIPDYKPESWRFSTEKQQMVKLPVFDAKDPEAATAAQFLVEYGFSFYDRKYIDTRKLTQIWDCNINDYLSANLSLKEYVKLHTPLMLKQFPYSMQKKEAEYVADFNRYNYTGLYFDADNLITIKDVDQDSPAYAAGIRPGYLIRKINNKKFDHTKETLSAGYKRFISETMPLRDPSTQFTNADGFAGCMLWDAGYYPEIAKEFNKADFFTNFSYLYGFEKYVNYKNDNRVVIEAWDGMQNRIFTIKPEIRQSVTIRAL
jgi:hypothetical protein